MSEIVKLSISQALYYLKNKHMSPTDLVTAHIEHVKKYNSRINAFILLDEENALKKAAISDENYMKNQARKLEGIPIGIKDLFCTKNIRTTACSKVLYNFIPPYESTVTQKISDAGTISLGKLNCDEFAMGSANINSIFGNVINPWSKNEDLVPGGSSGGSAAAVSSFMAMGSLGTDTGGSIRQPASFTGIVGIKPSYGRCSRYGMIAFASSLDQAGVFARNVMDAALLLENAMGYDPKDSTSADLATPDLKRAAEQKDVRGFKIGIPRHLFDGLNEDISSAWETAIDVLSSVGVSFHDISLPHTKYAIAAYYVIAPAEASSNLARYDGIRYGYRAPEYSEDFYETNRVFGDEVKRRIMIGTYVLSSGFYDAYYSKAQKVRRLILEDFTSAFENVDAILMPTAPSSAFALNAKLTPVEMYLNDVFTIPPSLAGLPAMSVPICLDSKGLPLGIQIVSKMFDETTMVRIAAALENALGLKLNSI